VAELTGTNLFAGTARTGGEVVLDGGGSLVAADHLTAGAVFAVVHPRAVALHRAHPEGSARNAWPGRITALEPVGDPLRGRGEAEPAVVAEVTGNAVRELELGEGAEVWISVKATEIDVYPA
jgi:molybdate transport system ATP-binding protein